MGLTHIFSLLGICISVTAPEVLLQSVEMYGDITFFAGTVLVLWLCLKTWQDGFVIRDILLAAFVFGLLASTKSAALPVCLAFGALYLGIVYWRNAKQTRPWKKLGHVAFTFSIIVIVACLLSGAWYTSGLRTFGNPIYPFKITLGKHTIFNGPYSPTLNKEMVYNQTKRRGVEAKWATLTEQWRPPTLSSWCGGLGAVTFIVGVPSLLGWLLLLLVSGKKSCRNGIPIVLLGFILLIVTCPTLEVARFSLFLLALAGLAVGRTAQAIMLIPRFMLGLATLGLCGYNVYVTMPSIMYRPRSPEMVAYNLFSGDSRASKRNLTPLQYDSIDYWVNAVATSGSTLATSPGVPLWDVYAPHAKNNIVTVFTPPGKNFEAWKNDVLATRATHLLIPRSFQYYDETVMSPQFKLLSNRFISTRNPDYTMDQPFNGTLFEVAK